MEPSKPTHTMTATEARGGRKMGLVRWVLFASLALVIPGLALVWYFTRP